MAEGPWLTILGLGEDGPDGLPPASRAALDAAEVVMGPARHMALVPGTGTERVVWPVPFADGLPILEGFRGRPTVVLASGDPFWFGAGSVIAARLPAREWRALPGPSTASLAAARLGWPLDRVTCLGLHAGPLSRLAPHLAPGARLIVLLRDGAAVAELAAHLDAGGWGPSRLVVLEALGGPRERVTEASAATPPDHAVAAPVCAAIEVAGTGIALPRGTGLPDALFDSDGQITKAPMRALTLAALAPVPGETLWDIGGGSGSVAIEWLLRDPSLAAVSVERRADRAARIASNAARLGVDRLRVVEGTAPEALADLPAPQAVFVGGGLSDALVAALRAAAPAARLVANAVTLEGEATLARWHERLGGELLRIELARAAPLGGYRGWRAAYPVVQWSFRP
ncbi:bifunctional cobalt-precorrin-7 (C(5))-methyltransferase/cobalt-precorrin-6B (C(15))-methyltransferase [Roseivivax isoporae]|uniref:Precorrin-6y methyltransferase n=1 Tax=Roseivivax isoporae LMG 25204 TaxID=1449351 RepID=X7F5J8_9RHOB|nr:bifunctional cobalt-precorrin-7 (C(5))-methyltransferase/cobalt-precorrin-6B (C(15))-methyltransferase [Roseivivax isoporae]ETX28040.1 precorrin-6y methyltransferase [Roseivivax isoporae LMG 25204]